MRTYATEAQGTTDDS